MDTGINSSVNSNAFSYFAASTFSRFSDYISGSHECTLVAISNSAPGHDVIEAIQRSAERLGYGQDACAFLCLNVQGDKKDGHLEPRELVSIIEGLDPVSICALDKIAAGALANAFGSKIDKDSTTLVGGRQTCSFEDFSDMLKTQEDRHRAWRLLKELRPLN